MWAKRTGFTIVELLIVIVVIAILAAITIVAYNGVQKQAKNSAHRQEIAQVERGIMTKAILDASKETDIAGQLIGYSERVDATAHTELELIRGVSGTPDLTMYIACKNVTSTTGSFTAPVLLRPSGTTNNIRFQTQSPNSPQMGIRIDTTLQTNMTGYKDGVRVMGADFYGWVEVSNAGKLVTYNYNSVDAAPAINLSAHPGWQFDTFLVGGQDMCTKTLGLLFEKAHDTPTRQSVINWLTDRFKLNI